MITVTSTLGFKVVLTLNFGHMMSQPTYNQITSFKVGGQLLRKNVISDGFTCHICFLQHRSVVLSSLILNSTPNTDFIQADRMMD